MKQPADFSLLVSSPVIDPESTMILDLGAVSDWKRSIRGMGGFWQGSFTMPIKFSADYLSMFHELLGFHLEERSAGGTTWQGLIYELEIEQNGIRRRRSLDLMSNAIDVTYSLAGETTDLGFLTEARSIDRYGRREERLSFDGISSTTATGLRARFLAESCWPWARPIGLGPVAESSLSVKVCGYVFTANWMFVKAGDGTEQDIDHWIESIVGTAEGLSSDHGGSVSGAGDCQFLQVGNLRSNTLEALEFVESDIRAWSQLVELAGLGDSNGDPWLVWVGLDRLVYYDQADLDPRYLLAEGVLYDLSINRGRLDPWGLWPGVARDLSYPIAGTESGSMFNDPRDLWIDEIEVSADGTFSIKTALFDESEILQAQLDRPRFEAGT